MTPNISQESLAADARRASRVLAPYIRRTPLILSPTYSALCGHKVYLKLENRQRTGSFKFRGATHRLLCMTDEERASGCVTASSGNHGAATAAAMATLGVHGQIYVPETVSEAKLEAIKRYGGDVRKFGTDGLDTELEARRVAESAGMVYVSPYNDEKVMAGQGSIGVELLEQLPTFEHLLIAVGGGGLISGIASVCKTALPSLRVTGCQPRASAVMAESCQAGQVVEGVSLPTLSDGTAGGIEAGAITFGMCQQLVDEFCLVGERGIAEEMQRYLTNQGDRVEGAAGVALAALQQVNARPTDRSIVIICGGNVSDATFASAVELANNSC